MLGLGSLASAAAITTVLLAAFAAVPYDKEISYGFQRRRGPTPASGPVTPADGLPYTRRSLNFSSQGTTCDAWLYTPNNPDPNPDPGRDNAAGASRRWPIVIMAHGLGGQKDLGLHRFADAFAQAGLAALVFDYRTFGGSDGEPRHWVSPRRHLQDWRAAVTFVKSGALGSEYDTDKVALWGTSFAGGHVLVTAAEQPPGSIAAIISMIPHLDGFEASKANVRRRGLLQSLRMLLAGAHDATRAAAAALLRRIGLLDAATPAADGGGDYGATAADVEASGGGGGNSSGGTKGGSPTRGSSPAGPLSALAPLVSKWLAPHLAPAYVKVIGTASDLALMQVSPQELESYYSKHPSQYEGGWQPRVLARFALETSSYRPIASVPRLSAPVLFLSAARDALCPVELVRRAAGLVPGGNGSLVELDCSHFDAYRGTHFESAAEAMVRFVREKLLPGAA